jgi:hypothetical protein
LGALVLIVPLAGCSPTEPTEIVAGMVTQMQVPKEIKMVGLVVQSGGRQVFCEGYKVADGTVTLPSTFGASSEGDISRPVTVTVLGFTRPEPKFETDCVFETPNVGDDSVNVMRRRRSTYVENRALYLPMPIRQACTDVKCPEGQTCLGGVCEPMDIDSSTLVDYDDRLVFGRSNTCFDVSNCLPAYGSIPAQLVDPETCEFEVEVPEGLPMPSNAALNVRVVHQNYTPEVLDLDDKEGFVVSGEPGSKRFRLAENLCTSRYKMGKMMGVSATVACPSKTPLQPICAADQEAILDGSSSPFGPALCVAPERLVPTESALYVLMDQSQSMQSFFGADGLQQLLSLSLEDPVFERTRVAFKFLPAAASDCSGPNEFATPSAPMGVPFTLAKEARSLVAPLIADSSNVLASDPPLYLDAVMSSAGAYGALRDLQPTAPTQAFNRRALLIIGNRDFVSRCSAIEDPAALAASALDGGIHTYVVVLSAPSGTDQGGRDPVMDAGAIAAAGGTSAFDATSNSDVGALALQTIVTDLGSCLYDAPKDGLGTALSQSVVTYLNPLSLSRESISFNEACSEQNKDASGWNRDEFGRIRICGSACESLRNVAKYTSALAAQAGRPAPLLPLHMTKPCDD